MVLLDQDPIFKPRFEHESQLKPNEIQNCFANTILLPWAQGGQSGLILDVAAGQGIESGFLQNKGFRSIALDESRLLTANSYSAETVRADTLYLPFRDHAFAKAFFKDALMFLSTGQKLKLLAELHRVIQPGGSLLVISQLSDMVRVDYLPHGSKIVQRESFPDEEGLGSMASLGEICNVEYLATPKDLKYIALKRNFNMAREVKYRFDEELAIENRWVPGVKCPSGAIIGDSGFVMEFVSVG